MTTTDGRTLVSRQEVDPAAWDAFVEAHPDGWWFHTSAWAAYALAYAQGTQDQSVAVLGPSGAVLGVVPAAMHQGVPFWGGQPFPMPLGEVPATAHGAVSRPGRSPAKGRIEEQWDTHVIDLRQPDSVRWSRVRKSFRQSIVRAKLKRAVFVVGSAAAGRPATEADPGWAVEQARGLHLQSAGRVTRDPATWSHMADWVRRGDGLVAIAKAPTGSFVGYAYAIRWKDWAYYASGVTAERDLSHALVWALAEALALDGRTRYFEVGWDVRDGDTEKDRGIAFFKSGFGGERWPVWLWRAGNSGLAAPTETGTRGSD